MAHLPSRKRTNSSRLENRWLEYNYVSFLGPALFSGAVAVSFQGACHQDTIKNLPPKGKLGKSYDRSLDRKTFQASCENGNFTSPSCPSLEIQTSCNCFPVWVPWQTRKRIWCLFRSRKRVLETGIPQAPMRVLNNPWSSLSMAWSLMQIILEDIYVPASLSVLPRMNGKDG